MNKWISLSGIIIFVIYTLGDEGVTFVPPPGIIINLCSLYLSPHLSKWCMTDFWKGGSERSVCSFSKQGKCTRQARSKQKKRPKCLPSRLFCNAQINMFVLKTQNKTQFSSNLKVALSWIISYAQGL